MTSPYEPFHSTPRSEPHSESHSDPHAAASANDAPASPYSAPTHSDSTDGLGETLRAMWATRPPRIPAEQGGNAKIAGVCEGIGARFGIDPVLPRVAFVATTLAFGGGLAAYFLAWALMPRYSKASSPVEDLFGRRDGETSESGLAIALLIGFLMTSGAWSVTIMEDSFFPSFSSSALGIALFTGLIWFFLYRHRPTPPAGLLAAGQLAQTDAQQAQPAADPEVDMSMFTPVDGYPFPPGRNTPPAWDPLGAAPDTWHLPDPRPAEQPKKKRSLFKTLLVIALSFFGVALAAALVIAATVGFGVVRHVDNPTDGLTVTDGFVFDDREYTPTSVNGLPQTYDFSVGYGKVDFSQIRDWDQLNHRTEVTIDAGVGNLDIVLPKGVSYSLTCDDGVGTTNCREQDNPDAKFAVHVDAGVGNVTIDYPTAAANS
ncbi:PspC domain-containing protein [Corynebacterium sp. 32222D000AT]|uniref:PspC domain-containing protein n=1 Tax=unclassified Corynebacterium TaxID=2624378 RepID=UPI002A99A28F|nr:PspC domain-containing protein [Mycobacteriaceae bacterium]MDY5828334.1 PspC domain-containing protein [Corynebacterium sp.]